MAGRPTLKFGVNIKRIRLLPVASCLLPVKADGRPRYCGGNYSHPAVYIIIEDLEIRITELERNAIGQLSNGRRP